VTQGLGEVAFADADLTDDEYGSVFAQVAVGGQIVHERAVELWEPIEVELIERFVGAKGGAAQAQRELLQIARDEVGLWQLSIGHNVRRWKASPAS
jgi:hypothetical protein